jgi:outer membrane receptor protein involved in Fe transport
LERTTATVAFYVNDTDQNINFSQLPESLDPYTVTNPPPGWRLPPSIIGLLAQRGTFLPRTAFTYLNLGPVRQKGIELAVDHRISESLSAYANYSWQAEPTILDDEEPFPVRELALPPTNRFNAGFSFAGTRFLASGAVSAVDKAFWSDVLNAPFHGFSDSYAMVNGSFGVKWAQGRITTLVKTTNLFDEDVQQHVFGDFMKRSVMFELRFSN